jgi:hypothetical protein
MKLHQLFQDDDKVTVRVTVHWPNPLRCAKQLSRWSLAGPVHVTNRIYGPKYPNFQKSHLLLYASKKALTNSLRTFCSKAFRVLKHILLFLQARDVEERDYVTKKNHYSAKKEIGVNMYRENRSIKKNQ